MFHNVRTMGCLVRIKLRTNDLLILFICRNTMWGTRILEHIYFCFLNFSSSVFSLLILDILPSLFSCALFALSGLSISSFSHLLSFFRFFWTFLFHTFSYATFTPSQCHSLFLNFPLSKLPSFRLTFSTPCSEFLSLYLSLYLSIFLCLSYFLPIS